MTVSTNQKNEIVQFDANQIQIIKNVLCKGITDDELNLFSAVCRKTGLDPFMKQIYAVKRHGRDGPQMTIQTSIDGYRLIAERTGRYCPGKKPEFEYKDGKVFSATVFLKKQTLDGTWHEIEACAYYSEYAPPVTKSGYENPFWKDKPHIMLAKCAESLALRMAFPNELSSLRTREEMEQAVDNLIESKPIESCISELQSTELMQLLDKCSIDYQNTFNDWLTSKSLNSLQMLPQNLYLSVKKGLSAKAEENQFAGLGHESTGTE